jgi:PhnB protein
MQVQPYLFFNGRCEEALNFYRQALGAEIVSVMRFRDAPDPQMAPPNQADKVMHATLRIGESLLFASDGRGEGETKFTGFSVSIAAETPEEGQRLFNALAAGGKIDMPYAPTFWTKGFGMLTDRFGVSWMVNAAH